tara:strand:+ start:1026 stop:1439 length:414 start_codon:yes stop_codon:yes gene_type:complete
MKLLLESWREYLSEEPQDSSVVAKIVLVNSENKVLFLKRTDYVNKFKGEWDLPGGHVHVGEKLFEGLQREVEEETGLKIFRASLFTKLDNLHFFRGKYEKGNIILSNEHSEFAFRDPFDVDVPTKFEKIAQMVIKND